MTYHFLYARSVSVAFGDSLVDMFLLYMFNASLLFAWILWLLLKLNIAASHGLLHDIADLLFLGVREVVVPHREFRESGLSGEQDEQQCHALVPSFKPVLLHYEGEVAERGDLGVGEGLHKLVPLLCTAASPSNKQRIEATAAGYGLGGEFEKDATVGRCRV